MKKIFLMGAMLSIACPVCSYGARKLRPIGLKKQSDGKKKIGNMVIAALRNFGIGPNTVTVAVKRLRCQGRCDSMRREICISDRFIGVRQAALLEFVIYRLVAYLYYGTTQKIAMKPSLKEKIACACKCKLHAEHAAVGRLLKAEKYGAVLHAFFAKLKNIGIEPCRIPTYREEYDNIVGCLYGYGYRLIFSRQSEILERARKLPHIDFEPQGVLFLVNSKTKKIPAALVADIFISDHSQAPILKASRGGLVRPTSR